LKENIAETRITVVMLGITLKNVRNLAKTTVNIEKVGGGRNLVLNKSHCINIMVHDNL